MRPLHNALLLLLVGAAIVAPAADNSHPLAQYIRELQQLRQSVVTAADSKAVFSVAAGLPSEFSVECNGRVFTISTVGIRQALREYGKDRTPANLAAVTSQLDLMVGDARGMESAKIDPSAERHALTEILSRREFRKVQGETWLDRLKAAARRWLARLLERILTSSAFPVVSRVLIWALLALAIVTAVFLVIRNYRQGNVYTQFAGSPDAVSAKPWRDWQAEAQAAAREGRWRDAVHLSYWAAISFLEGQGLWRPDRARTPREYLNLLPEGDTHRDPLRLLTGSFEKVWYGTDPATAETYAGASTLLERMGCR